MSNILKWSFKNALVGLGCLFCVVVIACAFLAPVLFFQLVLMALYAFYKTNSGQGFEWKGRKVR